MDFKTFVDFLIMSVLGPSLSLILSAAVVFFLWNIFGIIRKSDQPEELAKMKNHALWGAIAIAVMVSMWGLVNFFVDTFQLNTTPIQVNQIDRYNQY
jgi:heme A synthase